MAGGTLAAVAGCIDLPTSESGQRDRPGYHRYVPARDAGGEQGTFFVTLDMAGLRELEGSGANFDDAFPTDLDLQSSDSLEDVDPLLAYPAVGVFAAALGIGFGLVPYGFGDQVLAGFTGGDDTESATATETDNRVDTAVLLEGSFVLAGTFDPAVVDESVESFERTDERDGYDIYEGTGDDSSLMDTEGLAFAVSEEAIVALSGSEDGEPRPRLDRVLDTATGAGDRLSGDGDGDWALRTAGHGEVALGGFGVEPDGTDGSTGGGDVDIESVFQRADGLVSSLDVESDHATGTIAAVFPEGETPDRESIEAEVGASADGREVEIDGTRVSVAGTWEYEPGTATPTDSGA